MLGFGSGSFSRRSNSISLLGRGAAGNGALLPSPSWDGNPQSGFSVVPADTARVSAKPVVHMLQPPSQFFTERLTIGAMAFANDGNTLIGGIDRLRFHFEGNTRDVVQTEVRAFTRADGSVYHCPAYWIDLARPANRTGVAHLFIEAIPADATMQPRVLGPFPFSLSTALHDVEIEVAPSLPVIVGQRYQALGPALAYVRSQASKNPRITITQPGTYDFLNAGFGFYQPQGYVTIEATAPVFLGHKTQKASDTAALVRPNIDGFWFKGPNVTLDFRYMLQLYNEQGNRKHVFDGCVLTNTDGRDSYWRKSVRPIVPVRGRNYYLDCTVTEMDNATANAFLARGVVFDTTYGDIGQGAQAIIGCKTVDHTAEFFATDLDALIVQGPAGATLSAAGAHNAATRDFTARVNGVTVGTYQAKSSDTAFQANDNYHVAQVVNWINTLPGWAATLLDDTRRAVVISTRGSAGQGFTNLDVSSPQTLVTMFDVHADFYQQPINDAVGSENVLIYGNIGVNWTGQVMLPGGRNPAARDMFFINNAFYTNPDNSTPYAVNSAFFSQFSRAVQSHVVFAHNTLANQGVLLRDDIELNQDSYCLLANNSIRSMRWNGTQVGTAVITGNHVHAGVNNPPQGATGTTQGGDESSLYVNAAAGDFAPTGSLLQNLKAPIFDVDINGIGRGELAPAGSIA